MKERADEFVPDFPVAAETSLAAGRVLVAALRAGALPHADGCPALAGVRFFRGGCMLADGAGSRCTCGVTGLCRIARACELEDSLARDIRVLFEYWAAVNAHRALLVCEQLDDRETRLAESDARIAFWRKAVAG